MGLPPLNDPRDKPGVNNRLLGAMINMLDKPTTWVRENIVEPMQGKNKQYYYHRRYRRVPTIDECYTNDQTCRFEANEQMIRDKKVDEAIVQILRNRRVECELYHGADSPKKCEKAINDYLVSTAHFFEKWGDLGGMPTAKDAYMKQKHRMIWERRHGKVGSGMKMEAQPLD